MKAVSRIQARVGGVSFDIPAGREVPPELAEFYAANKAIDGLVKSGAIEPDAPAATKKKD